MSERQKERRYSYERPRILSHTLPLSPKLAACSPLALALFDRVICTADDQGIQLGSGVGLKGTCFPMNAAITPRRIERARDELVEAGVIVLYEVGGSEYVSPAAWWSYQGGMPRSYPSRFPLPPGREEYVKLPPSERLSSWTPPGPQLESPNTNTNASASANTSASASANSKQEASESEPGLGAGSSSDSEDARGGPPSKLRSMAPTMDVSSDAREESHHPTLAEELDRDVVSLTPEEQERARAMRSRLKEVVHTTLKETEQREEVARRDEAEERRRKDAAAKAEAARRLAEWEAARTT